jgi:hypothetical protein
MGIVLFFGGFMKKTGLMLIIAMTIFCGCHKEIAKNEKRIDAHKIAGVWRVKGGPWQITVDKGGKVTSAFIQICAEEIRPNRTTYVEMLDDTIGSFTAGDFILTYDDEKKYMEIALEIKKIDVHYKNDYVKGKSEIVFAGYLSENYNIWNAERIEIPDYGPRFPIDVNEIEPIKTVFLKN